MTFPITNEVEVIKDEKGIVTQLYHPDQPYESSINGAATAETTSLRHVADAYVRDVLLQYELSESMADNLGGDIGGAQAIDEGPMLRYVETAKAGKLATVAYSQTVLGLPVWETGLTVEALLEPPRVIGSDSSVQKNIDVHPPSSDAAYLPNQIDARKLADLLGLDRAQTPTINGKRLLVYQYDAENRGNGTGEPEPDDETNMHVANPTLSLPELPSTLESGRFYVVSEVLFTLTLPESGADNWRAFVDPKTGAVLRLDVFVSCVDGYVYLRDPLTETGDTTVRPDSAASVLDRFRDRVSLDMLTPPQPSKPQQLRSEFVKVVNIYSPNVPPPTKPVGSDFFYSVPTNDFAAVNALYHCDRVFRMLDAMPDLSVREYFNGTDFPVRVDHRVNLSPNSVNAAAKGDAQGDGLGSFLFALLHENTNVGMAASWRVTLHEFGHAILWDKVHSGNFYFAHSAGDSLAAILNDPDSEAPDRFRSFPWIAILRRHDRRVVDGWGWGGRIDRQGGKYLQEQILSTTLFRYYRAIGGDHSDRAVRHKAARYAIYMIYKAVSQLSHVNPPKHVRKFAHQLMEADKRTDVFEGLPGSMTYKVIRWAFERQGLYQPPGAPRPAIKPGAPPAVDVYIDDGRDGEYDPRSIFVFSSSDIWNRNTADGGLEHQQPVFGKSNYLYVRVKNRGTRQARNVVVKMYISTSLGQRLWPHHWDALDTASLAAKGAIPSQGEKIVGPFVWTRDKGRLVAMLATVSARGDKSIAEKVTLSVPAAQLTHYDNNNAGRLMKMRAEPPVVRAAIKFESWPNLPIPDADPTGVVTELRVAKEGTVVRLEVPVTILHTYVSDLKVSVTSPAKTTVVLYDGAGDWTDNLIVTFTHHTVTDMRKFEGEEAKGVWRLHVLDHVGADIGRVVKWGLNLELS